MTTEHPRFLASELACRTAGECRFHVIPVPYEATVSYGGGTARGPAAILEASNQLELWTGRSIPSRHGIYTWPAVDCAGNAEEVLERIACAARAALRNGPQSALPGCVGAPTVPIILGGEHTVTLGVLRALQEQYGPFGVIQFDAHADLRDSYEGSRYSHACVMRRAVQDLGLPLFQIGVRSLSREEEEYRQEKNIQHLDARVARCSLAGHESFTGLHIPEEFPRKVFVTFDIDALDASLMPATGTPEPGGLFWWDALTLVEHCLAGRICLGFDVVELAPVPHLHAPTYTAARLVHEIMEIVNGCV